MNKEKTRLICNALDDKKANRITVIDIEGISVVADGFIIADGDNRNQVQAMADNVQDEMLKQLGYHCKSVNGYQSANWILLDYQDLVVHLFDKDSRTFYDLERLWRDGQNISLEELA